MSEWARIQRDKEASCLKYATDLPDLHQRGEQKQHLISPASLDPGQ